MSKKRVTITVPEDVAERLEGQENVSAFFADAVRRADRRTRLEQIRLKAEPQADTATREVVRRRVRLQMAEADARRADRMAAAAQAASDAAHAKVEQLRDAA